MTTLASTSHFSLTRSGDSLHLLNCLSCELRAFEGAAAKKALGLFNMLLAFNPHRTEGWALQQLWRASSR